MKTEEGSETIFHTGLSNKKGAKLPPAGHGALLSSLMIIIMITPIRMTIHIRMIIFIPMMIMGFLSLL